MQITPSHLTLQALGAMLSPPGPVRRPPATIAAEAVRPSEKAEMRNTDQEARARNAAARGARLDVMV